MAYYVVRMHQIKGSKNPFCKGKPQALFNRYPMDTPFYKRWIPSKQRLWRVHPQSGHILHKMSQVPMLWMIVTQLDDPKAAYAAMDGKTLQCLNGNFHDYQAANWRAVPRRSKSKSFQEIVNHYKASLPQ